MSIDEQVQEYMHGWEWAASTSIHTLSNPDDAGDDDYGRGYAAGWRTRIAAEQAERERLEVLCPHCKGDPAWRSDNAVGKSGMLFGCTVCHGTGRKRA